MNYRIYFEFKAAERQLIGVSLNGENIGLQTEVVNGQRIYVIVSSSLILCESTTQRWKSFTAAEAPIRMIKIK